jgi:hypothetical protein
MSAAESAVSGYNQSTGVFELTWTKASHWFRRADVPEECAGLKNGGMDFFACLLRHYGLDVFHVGNAFLKVRATPEQMWEALSGQPPDPQRSSYYYRG